jgi:hypothetical protein
LADCFESARKASDIHEILTGRRLDITQERIEQRQKYPEIQVHQESSIHQSQDMNDQAEPEAKSEGDDRH